MDTILLRFIAPLVTALLILQPAPLRAAPAGTSGGGQATSTRRAMTGPLHLTLAQAVDEALAGNPGLLAAEHQVRRAERSAAAAFRQHFGEIDAVAWASRYQDDQILRPMSRQLLAGGFNSFPFDRDQLHYGLTFELPLYIGGKLLAGVKLARLKADEARALLGGTRWQVRSNVISIYAANQAIDRALVAYEEQVSALEKTRERLKLMVDSGKKPDVDLLKTIETLEQARAELAGARADRAHSRAILAALLDLPVDQSFALDPLPSEFPRAPGVDVDVPGWLAKNSTLRGARLRVKQAECGKHIARGEFLPKLSLQGDYIENTASSGLGPEATWELRVGVSLPIFAGGRRVAAYQSAAAGQRSAELALRQTQRQLEAELYASLARFSANKAELNAAKKRVDAGQEAARIEEIRYDTGAGTIEDLLRARTRAAAAEAALAKEEEDVLAAAARINAMVEKEVVR